MELKEIQEITSKIKENVNKIIIGKSQVIDLILTSILAGGHVLLEDTPGTGKTVLAKSIAKSINSNFKRIQFTPDLLPSDITGLNIFNQKENQFTFIKGPIFTNILLADEINRATPRTQSSLLESMEEKQITTDGTTRYLEKPFLVIATQNPIETAGTFPLPEAQLDRFMMQLNMGYPTENEELEIINRFISDNPLEKVNAVCNKEDIIEMQNLISTVFVHNSIRNYIVNIVQATRKNSSIALGISPRGTLALLKSSQVYAAINGRNYVIPDDVKFLAPFVLAHRIIPSNGFSNRKTNVELINKLVSGIEVPTENWEK
ncbi:MAG: AAA family ATPase [Clostridium sp.]|nr:MoxR family ATPase [Clostridium sp.]